MDNGEVIPGLDEEWTLGGAKLLEWIAGMAMLMMAGGTIFSPVARHMPQLMLIWVGTTFGLAALRRAFPDEERGVRNAAMTALGVPPPGIPVPAELQPYWSAAPLRELNPQSEFMRLGLDKVFAGDEEEAAPDGAEFFTKVEKH